MTSNKHPSSLTLHLHTLQLGGPQGWVDASDSECLLLQTLASGVGTRLDTASLLASVGKSADVAGKRALEVQIVRLRKKLLQVGGSAPTIKSIRGFGYQLCVPLLVQNTNLQGH